MTRSGGLAAVTTSAQSVPVQRGLAPKGPRELAIFATLPDSPRLHRLLDNVRTMMMAEGFLHLSTADIAARQRCSKSTLYKLAPNADGLFELVIRLWIAEGEDELDEAYAVSDTASERLTAFLNHVVDATGRVSSRFLHDAVIVTSAFRLMEQLRARREETLSGIIESGVAALEFRPVNARLVAKLIIMTLEGVCKPDVLAEVGLSASAAIAETYGVLQNGLVRPR